MTTLTPTRRKATVTKKTGVQKARAKARPIARLGASQRAVLDRLAASGSYKSAVDLRDAIGKHGDQGTRAVHAILLRLLEAGLVERTGANGEPRQKSGAVVRFKITVAGRAARKAR